jgi:hypothetical protein
MQNEPAKNEPAKIATLKHPYYTIPKPLFKFKPSWKALIAYNALAYFEYAQTCQYTSIAQMADHCGVSDRTMRRGLDELEKLKVIQIKLRFKDPKNKEGKPEQLPNEYILLNIYPEEI